MQQVPRQTTPSVTGALLALSCVAAVFGFSPVLADEDDSAQRIPSDVRGLYSPIDRSLQPQAALPGGPHQHPRDTRDGEIELDEPHRPVFSKDRLQDRDPFFRDMIVDLYARSHYFDQDNAIGPASQAWAGGAAIAVRTGYFRDWFKLEAAVATSQPLYAPEGEGGTLLLTQNQAEVSSLFIANAHVRFLGQEIVAGRQLIKTPYLNPYDTRMIPNAFEGIVITPRRDDVDWFDYSLGYFSQFKARDSSYFVPFSDELGVKDDDRGVLMTGIKLKLVDDVTVGGFNYYIADVLNTTFAEADWILPQVIDGVDFRVSVNYTNQQTVGADLMPGGPFSTSQVSWRIAGSYMNATAYLAGSVNADSADLVSPFSSFPAYTNLDQMHFQEAGTRAIVGGLAYDFSDLITEGLKLAVLFGTADGIIDPTTGAGKSDQREIDLKVGYLPKSGAFRDTHVQFIYSHVEFPGNPPGERAQPQFHGIVTYQLPVL